MTFRKGRLLRGNVDNDRASCRRRKRRGLHPLRVILKFTLLCTNDTTESKLSDLHGRDPQFRKGRVSGTGLAFRTDSSARPQACTLIGAAAMPEIDGNRQHTMRAVSTGAGGSSPDVRQGPCGGRRARFGVMTSCCVLGPRTRVFHQSPGDGTRRASF